MAWSQMADMELDDEDRIDACLPIAMPDNPKPQYPWGLKVCLTHSDLEKLGLDHSDCDVGDFIDLRAFAVVMSKTVDTGENGETCRIELQIQKLAVENETTEEPGE